MVEEKKEKQKTEAQVIEVPASWGEGIKLEDGTIVTDRELLVKVYNLLQEVRKNI